MDPTAGEATVSSMETLALRLIELKGAVDVGNERTAGQLALLVEKSQHAAENHAEFRKWVERELDRHEKDHQDEARARTKADEDEERARTKADESLAAELRALERKLAVWSGVGITLSAIGSTLLAHVWPH